MRSLLFATALIALVSGCTDQSVSSASSAGAGFPSRLQALGTEPFWSIAIDGGAIAYSSADEPDKQKATVARSQTAEALTLDGVLSGAPITVTITRGTCSDGMSDTDYPYSAKVRWGQRRLDGCARRPL